MIKLLKPLSPPAFICNLIMIYNGRNAIGASIILLPACYFTLTRGLKKFWIDNELRVIYKDIV